MPKTVQKNTSLPERIAVIETTALMGKRALGGVVVVLVGLFSFFYTNVIPDKVEQGISNSATLNTKFAEVREDVKKLDGRFEQLISTIRPLVNPKIVAAALKDSASADQASLPAALVEIKKLLSVVREMNVPLRGKDYNEISKPLFRQYVSSKQPLKQELWLALIDLANTRTKTDAILHQVTDTEIAKQQAAKNCLEGDIDLSARTTWKNTIFRNGKIKISRPDQDLVLTRVRFIDDEFESVENETGRKLLQSVLENDSPEVTASVARFKVLDPVGKVGKVVRLKLPSPSNTLQNTLAKKYSH